MKTNLTPELMERGNAPLLTRLLNTDPALGPLAGVPAGTGKHAEGESTLQHVHRVLQRALRHTWGLPERLYAMIAAAALFHDIGKLFTPQEKWPKHVGHDSLGAAALPGILEGWPEDLVQAAVFVASFHMRLANWGDTKVAGRLKLVRDMVGAGGNSTLLKVLAIVTSADSPAKVPDWQTLLAELGDYQKALALPAASLVHPSRLEGKSPEAIANILWEERLEWVTQEAAMRAARRSMIAVFSTSDIYEWRPTKGLTAEDEPKIRWQNADGASITTGKLEQALVEGRTVFVATTKTKWLEHEEWWMKLLGVSPQEGRAVSPVVGVLASPEYGHAVFLSDDRPISDDARWTTGWSRLFAYLNVSWPTRGGREEFWTSAQTMLLRRLKNGDRLTDPWPEEEE